MVLYQEGMSPECDRAEGIVADWASQIMLAGLAVCFLLLQRSFARFSMQVRQVEGVPQYVLDYGMGWYAQCDEVRLTVCSTIGLAP